MVMGTDHGVDTNIGNTAGASPLSSPGAGAYIAGAGYGVSAAQAMLGTHGGGGRRGRGRGSSAGGDGGSARRKPRSGPARSYDGLFKVKVCPTLHAAMMACSKSRKARYDMLIINMLVPSIALT